jgi:phosphate transport system ATP-binding protein
MTVHRPLSAAAGETALRPPPDDRIILEAEHLDFFYDNTQALFGVDLAVERNRITALVGPSGCGKSTLLRAFNRIHELYPGQRVAGAIRLDGVDALKSIPAPDLRARVGMVFQKPTPFPMSIFENVAFGVRLYQRPSRAEMSDIVEAALTRAALWDEVKDKLHESGLGLSGGQQQRLCVARAIAIEPEVLLLDEPASSLDPGSSAKLEASIVELKSLLTVVIVTHNLAQAARLSDHAGFMYLGRMLEFAPTNELFHSPRLERTREYVKGQFG